MIYVYNKGGVFLGVKTKNRFGPNRFQSDLCVVLVCNSVRSEAYYLKMILHTHSMVIRPLENFLQALEVGRVQSKGLKKWIKTWVLSL